LHTIKPLKPGGLIKSEKWVVLGAFIVAAILTPTPDPINQTIMAGPVIVVYQLGVIAVLLSIARTSRKLKKQAREQAAVAEVATPAPIPLQELASPELALAAEAEADLGIERTSSADLEALPVAPVLTLEPTPEQIAPLAEVVKPQPQVIDGFMRRPGMGVQVPQRPAQPLRPQSRPVPEAPKPGPARGFYVDGIIAPRTV
jgi:hypothetical protein